MNLRTFAVSGQPQRLHEQLVVKPVGHLQPEGFVLLFVQVALADAVLAHYLLHEGGGVGAFASFAAIPYLAQELQPLDYLLFFSHCSLF